MRTSWGMTRDVSWSHTKIHCPGKTSFFCMFLWLYMCLHVCMYASLPDLCLWVNVCLNMLFQNPTNRRGDGLHIRTISVGDYTDRGNQSRSWSWFYSRVSVREVSMIVRNMMGPWYSPHTPLLPGNNHSTPQWRKHRFDKRQKLQTDGCQWCTEGNSFLFSEDSISSLSFYMGIKTNDKSLYSQRTGRLLFLWKGGLAGGGALRVPLFLWKFYILSVTRYKHCNHQQVTVFSVHKTFAFPLKGGLAVGCALRVPLFVLSSFLSLSFFISFFTLALSNFSPSLPISGSLYLSDRMETFWCMIRDVCWSHQK